MSWDLSCPDWEARLRSGRSLVPDLPIDVKRGNRAVAVFNKLRLADVPGTPPMDDAGADWFRDIVRALFGSLDPVTRARMIRELFVLVPKKNSKTTNGALLMLAALLLNERPRAPFMMTAPVQEVADVAFNAVAGAIELDGVLAKKLHVRNHLKTVVHRETKAELKIMTFDPATLTGPKYVGALVDELHVSAKNAKAASAIRQIRGGMVPFPEAFLAFITTQSEEAPAGVFRAELMKARAIRDGRQQGAMLPVLYEFPVEMQKNGAAWRDAANWHMVTPNAGRSITIERLKEEFRTAETTGEDELRAWASQHLNIEIGLALHSDGWAGADFWEQQGDPELTLAALLELSEVVVVGIDGGGLDDLLGLCVLGRQRGTRRLLAWHHAWAHNIVLERRKDIAPMLKDFAAAGSLTIVDDPGDDVAEVAHIVCDIRDRGLLPENNAVGVDVAGIGDIVDELTSPEREIALEQIIGVSQGWRLNGAIKSTERKLAGAELAHGGTGLMNWVVGNARVEVHGNAVLVTKKASGTAKIDPLMATFDAMTLMALNPEAAGSAADFLADPIIV